MAKNELKRNYSCKDEVMLKVLLVIIANARKNLAELTKRNPNWTAAFLDALEKRIDDAYNNVLGINPLGNQKEATETVNEIKKEALSQLSTFKKFLNPVFPKNKTRKEEVLYNLGFTSFYKAASRRKLPDLVELLYTFETNMTPELKTEITTSGNISVAEIDAIIAFADLLKKKNVTQKSVQSNSPVITKEGVATLNDLYESGVPNFSTLVWDFYQKKDSPLADTFSFNKLKKIVNKPGNGGKDNLDAPPPTPPSNPTI